MQRPGHRWQGLRFYSKCDSKTLGGFQQVSNLIQDLDHSAAVGERKLVGNVKERKLITVLLLYYYSSSGKRWWFGLGVGKMRERSWRTD